MRKAGILIGALVGAAVTAPLVAVLYLADQMFDLPFVPYVLFDWIGRVLPGKIVTKTIETIVKVIDKLNLGETSSTAKTIEHILGIATFLGIGIVAGAALFYVLRRLDRALEDNARYLPGLAVGAVVGLPVVLITHRILYRGEAGLTNIASEPFSVLWLAAAFLVWGAILSWLYYRLRDAWAAGSVPEVPVTSEQLNRRQFLIRAGATTATITVFGAGLGRYLAYRTERNYQNLVAGRRAAAAEMPKDLPNAGDSVEPAPGTRPEYTPLKDHYRIDIDSRPPEINEEDWRLRITGLVDRPLTLTLDQIINSHDPMHQFVTLACISNPVGGDLTSTTRWTGVSLQEMLADAGVQDGATHLRITSADGFYETVALDLINREPRVMLAYNWDGIPLLYKHGFPLRIYIPDHYGMKQPKWITDIKVMDHDEDGYWVERGWDKEARMRATSVVDVAASDRLFEQNGVQYVPVGGIAHAGARGISKVEVRVDDGEWVEARLRKPLSGTTWVIWRYDWPLQKGEHTFRVRCYEGDGTPQIEKSNPTMPSGATGIHHLTREI